MIGMKKLSDIRANIVRAFTKAGLAPDAWMEKQISRATRGKRNRAEIETLMLVRDGLRSGATKKRRLRARSNHEE